MTQNGQHLFRFFGGPWHNKVLGAAQISPHPSLMADYRMETVTDSDGNAFFYYRHISRTHWDVLWSLLGPEISKSTIKRHKNKPLAIVAGYTHPFF